MFSERSDTLDHAHHIDKGASVASRTRAAFDNDIQYNCNKLAISSVVYMYIRNSF